MEVHAHTHTPRKKWTHYLWEFLMLFLAVFCGFLAENEREHFIEHRREKQYVRSFIEDLRSDTAELKLAITRAGKSALYSDSLLYFLDTLSLSDQLPVRISELNLWAVPRLQIIFTDRTSSQLKNAGALRLIRKTSVSDALTDYWKQIEKTRISLDRYLIYRERQRELTFKLTRIPEVDMFGQGLPLDSIKYVKVLNKDPSLWGEFSNLVAICRRITTESYIPTLEKQFETAKSLINIIKEEYHIK